MAEQISIESFLELAQSIPVVDVRSPAEYEQGHIPGAVNIPLFDNEERSKVGIRYKQGGKENAVLLGLEIVGPKMVNFVKQAKKIAHGKNILVHCWRGGMRSGSMAWLFETAGLNAKTLTGGYKAYRRYIRESFARSARLVVLGGYTGSGKTDILKEIARKNGQFLDIEGLAHHKGSAFGPLGQTEQPTNEQFENNLARIWLSFNRSQTIWLEDESRQLGRCNIPDPLFNQLRAAPVIKLVIPKNIRINRLVREYGRFEPVLLAAALEKIRERLGGKRTKDALTALEKGDLFTVADISLQYYDKAYEYGIKKRNPEKVFELNLQHDNPEMNAERILSFLKQIKPFGEQ